MQKGFPKYPATRPFSKELLDEFIDDVISKMPSPFTDSPVYFPDTPANRALLDRALREVAGLPPK